MPLDPYHDLNFLVPQHYPTKRYHREPWVSLIQLGD